jgi:hypothetical protein
MKHSPKRFLLLSILAFLLAFCSSGNSTAQEKDEETYSISLTQTAEPEVETEQEIRVVEKKDTFNLEGKKVVTETYTVKKGDRLWQLLRERGLLEKKNLPEVLAALKKLNSSFSNLDVMYPGDKIVIPLTITPVRGLPAVAQKGEETLISLEQLKDLKLESYTVHQGDSLIKVVKGRYSLRDEQVNEAYLQILSRLNPEIENLNRIYPGQVVRLPIYTPQIVKMPIKREKPSRPPPETAQASTETPSPPPEQKKGPPAVSQQLTEFFALLGEEWINAGEHFIPLKAGGQVNLKAEAFPILSLGNGRRVIVDLHHELPEKMAQVIAANWDNYRVVHLKEDEDLRSALNKILAACEYYKIYKQGEPLELRGDITLQVSADWIIQTSEDRSRTLLINLADKSGSRIPPELRNFLANLGVKSIEYPSVQQSAAEPPAPGKADVLFAGKDKAAVIESVLNLTGLAFSRDVEMPVIQGRKSGVSLMVKADFFLYVDGKDSVIDFTGIGPDIIPLLKEYKVSVLSLVNEQDPARIVSRTLDFIGVKFDSKPHPFTAAGKEDSKNFKLTIPGIVFRDNHGRNVFASHLRLPDDIAGFLSRRGYKVLSLAVS